MRVRHAGWGEQSAIPIHPCSGDNWHELNLIIVIRCQIRGIHTHYRLHRWEYSGGWRWGDLNSWRCGVADARAGDADVCHHTTGNLRNRRGIGAVAANYVDCRTGDVARTATCYRCPDNKSTVHSCRSECLRWNRIQRQPEISTVPNTRDHLRVKGICGRETDRLVCPIPTRKLLHLISTPHGEIGKGKERHRRDAQHRIGNKRRVVPYHCCDTGIGGERIPARRPRQVIGGHIIVIEEHLRTKAGCVTPEIDCCQAVAITESHIPDAGDVGANHDPDKVGAPIERPVSDVGNAVRDRYTGQTVALTERIVPDAGDIGANYNPSQAGAPNELRCPDTGNAVRDRYTGQAKAISERTAPDVGDAVGERDIGQAVALPERATPDAGDVGANYDLGHAVAGIKRIVPDSGHAIGDGHARRINDWPSIERARTERRISNAGDLQAVGCAGDNYIAAATSVLVEVERPVVIGRENELGLNGESEQSQCGDCRHQFQCFHTFVFPF